MKQTFGPRFLAAVILLAFCLPAAAATFTVTTVNDSGPGSLRQAILSANGAGGGTVAFAIGSGLQTIKLKSSLPTAQHVVIDGRTQPGYTNKPIIELDGSLITENHALALVGGGAYALIVNRAPGAGVTIDSARIWNCYLGTDPTGMAARPNEYGVAGVGEISNSLISGNRWANVRLGRGATVHQNLIGTDATGEAALHTTDAMNVYVYGGGAGQTTTTIERNVIGGGGYGVYVWEPNVVIRENLIGVSRTGTPLPNYNGIRIFMEPDATIEANSVAYSRAAAIELISRESSRTRIVNNRIYNNAFGIDLGGEKATPNDPGDSDVGPNNLMNYPVITRAAADATGTTITGTLDTHPNTTFLIELFVTPSCNASGFGEGKTRVLSFHETTNAAGIATFSKRAAILTGGHVVTATATSDEEGTSEFSRCVAVEGAGSFKFTTATPAMGETGQNIALNVERQFGAVGTATVQYATSGTSAQPGSDYMTVSGTLTFADGESSKTITVPILDDTIFEGDETFTVTLSNATRATLGSPSAVTVTIADNDPAPVVYVEHAGGDEGASGTAPMKFRITLSSPAAIPITAGYLTGDGTATPNVDYVATSGTVTFAPGETVKEAEVQVNGDTLYEQNEYFRFTVTRNGLYAAQALGTIMNDDALPRISAGPVTVRETDGLSIATVTLTATQPVSGSVGFSLENGTATAGVDFVHQQGLVPFSNSTVETLEIEILGDDAVEDVEQFTLMLDSHYYSEFTVVPASIVRIEDDDIGIGPSKLMVPAGEARRGIIQIGSPAAADTAFMVTSTGADAVQAPTTVILPAGQTRVTFDVRALVAGRRETLTVTIPPAFGGGTDTIRVTTYTHAELTLTPAELTLYPGQVVTVNATFAPAGAPVAIALTSDGGVEVPQHLQIGADGHGSFAVKALKNGPFTITATLPIEYGSASAAVSGIVADPPEFPELQSVSPNNGSTAGGTRVDVRGALFRTDCTLTFGGVPATMLQYVDASTFNAIAPPHAAGTVDVVLTCGSNVSSLPHAFTYRGAGPSLSSVAPASGSTDGGTYVRIHGSDFASSCWPFFNGVASPRAIVRDANLIDAVVPAHAAGTVDVRLLCTGVDALLEQAFTFKPLSDPAAQIANIEPFFGAPGDIVTLQGSGFRPNDVVAFEGAIARVLDSTPESHTVVVPDLRPGRANVTIGAGTTVLATTGPLFTVGEASPPRVSRVVASAAAAGAEIVLEGTSMRAPYTFAMNGLTMPLVSLLPTRAVVRIPSDVAPGSHPIAVMNSANLIASLGPAVHVRNEGVVVSSVFAACAATDGGVEVTITGSGFAPGAIVTFDDIAATNVVVADATKITARVPANYAGNATIAVKNSDGSMSTLTDAFRYASPFDPSGCTAGRMRSVRH